MKKAIYYARVSTSLQEEKGTIESQKTELINQIKADGNILVKEYIDNGWSGARLDRPALDELIGDLKTDLFEVVYFLDSDRIARDVTFQNIIISELLKHNKEIIINGKNYIHNPENKFTLTVLGAVNELEKAKIVERLMRGRREKARRGAIVDGGGLYGYDYIKKTEKKNGYYVVNKKEAEVVKLIFETYANTDKSITTLIKFLEEKRIKTPRGQYIWGRSTIRRILMNTSYYGVHYFNKEKRIESVEQNGKYAKNTKTRTMLRDKSEWIPVEIPAIIDKQLFISVQEKLKRNYKLLRSQSGQYLLSGLMKCGVCDHTYTGVYWNTKKHYRCNYREKLRQHSDIVDIENKCNNQSVKGDVIENLILDVVKDKVLTPSILKKHIDILKSKKTESKRLLIKNIEKANRQVFALENKKKRILDLYSDGILGKEEYINKIEELDLEFKEKENKVKELNEKLLFIEKRKFIRKDINHFCRLAKKRFIELKDIQKTDFLKQIIEEIKILKNNDSNNKVIIRGLIPVFAGNNINLPIHCARQSCGRIDRRNKKI
jgi:site-specific DNA recombinase